MAALSFSDPDEPRPFAGCTRLLEQYRQTGEALLTYERRVFGNLVPKNKHLVEFGQSVSFVPVEVLESYLDDLLDLEVSDDSLFIKKPRPAKPAIFLLFTCIIALLYPLLAGPSAITGIFLPALVVVFFCAGLGSALYFVPRTKVIRRFSFATVVSRQIAARRGHDRTDMGNFATRLLMRDFWSRTEVPRASGLSAHSARVTVRYYH
jgi:hypothetical protein